MASLLSPRHPRLALRRPLRAPFFAALRAPLRPPFFLVAFFIAMRDSPRTRCPSLGVRQDRRTYTTSLDSIGRTPEQLSFLLKLFWRAARRVSFVARNDLNFRSARACACGDE